MPALAIIPARVGSKGIPNKNFRDLAGKSPARRAVEIAHECDLYPVLTTDMYLGELDKWFNLTHRIARPPELAQDDTPMIDVIQDVLRRVPEGDPIVLLQPTQPLRKPRHITKALELLTPDVDSVVSVVELPRTHHPDWQVTVDGGWLESVGGNSIGYCLATRRQDLEPTYIRDGTCYLFWRKTIARYGNIYGAKVRPLIIPASETCALDTPEDWAEAERRLLCSKR